MHRSTLARKWSFGTGAPIRQCRTVPLHLKGGETGFLSMYSSDFDVDPYVEMFFFPSDTLHLVAQDSAGQVLWKRDLGRGIVPGVWFCPLLAFDLDGDGDDEVFYVGNTDDDHPLGVSHYVLQRLNGRTGDPAGTIPWPHREDGYRQNLSNQFRNFILGGYDRGRARLVAVQGTYQDMFFECFDEDFRCLWETMVREEDPGARGSHMCPVLDINRDGTDELLWESDASNLQGGKELFCADGNSYGGHSDIVAPFYDPQKEDWHFLTCRETQNDTGPRMCVYDSAGNRVWGRIDRGHIDMGWVARLGDGYRPLAMGVMVTGKTCGPQGRFHEHHRQYVYDALTGESVSLPFSVYKTLPVDVNGDGYHEIVGGVPSGDGNVVDRFGNALGNIGGNVSLSGKLIDRPGEHMIVYSEDGTLSLVYDTVAEDSAFARSRYAGPWYESGLRIQGNGYNWGILGGY